MEAFCYYLDSVSHAPVLAKTTPSHHQKLRRSLVEASMTGLVGALT